MVTHGVNSFGLWCWCSGCSPGCFRGSGAGPLCLSGAALPGHPLDFTAFRW
nr:MAG TPA: hypothetical protein [Caudoviricetes sp.]